MNKIRIMVSSWKQYWGEMKSKRNEEGLTLIELMVVVVILGIIAAIAIPSISSAINSAKVSTTESDLSTLQEALQRYYISNNSYPSQLTDLISSSNGGPYVDITFPENDAWGHAINYATVTGTNLDGYILLSQGPNSTLTDTSPLSANEIYAAGGNVFSTSSSNNISATTPMPVSGTVDLTFVTGTTPSFVTK